MASDVSDKTSVWLRGDNEMVQFEVSDYDLWKLEGTVTDHCLRCGMAAEARRPVVEGYCSACDGLQ